MSASFRRLSVVLLLLAGAGCARGPLVGHPVPVAPPTRPLGEIERDLGAADPAVRAAAAWEIAGMRTVSDPIGARLLELTGHDPDANVRGAAVWALGHVGRTPADGGYDEPPKLTLQPALVYPLDIY